MTSAVPFNQPKGREAAEIARTFFGVQLHYADVLAAKAGIPLTEAITFHTNFHRLFAYGNLSKMPPDPEFTALIARIAAVTNKAARLDSLIDAYALRPPDPWPTDRYSFGDHFAHEAPDATGAVRIHFRNRFNANALGPLHASNLPQRRADLTTMISHIAARWPETTAIIGGSWLYNLEAYRRLFPAEFGASRTPLTGPRPTHGLSTWGQFLDYRGCAKPDIVARFEQTLDAIDITQPWLSFPYQVLSTTAPFTVFRREYSI
ncbi:MAG TPA: hypothetical protein PLN33_01920 [Hyphomonadaceae bacterium]|jgi:hypothetical protein|nr:hypothetical protein [Hyphomonadaceae bacterium]HPN04539.1 hypothetical protein [Hyphomonadaceae bacterium]